MTNLRVENEPFVVGLGQRSSNTHLFKIILPKELALKPYQTCLLAALVRLKAGHALLHFLSKHGVRALDGNNEPSK